jgi:hypothetical protein
MQNSHNLSVVITYYMVSRRKGTFNARIYNLVFPKAKVFGLKGLSAAAQQLGTNVGKNECPSVRRPGLFFFPYLHNIEALVTISALPVGVFRFFLSARVTAAAPYVTEVARRASLPLPLAGL